MLRERCLTQLLSVCLLVAASPAISQDTPTVLYHVGYMKVAPEKADQYVDLEQKAWKPVHQQRLQDGTIVGWDLYAVSFPGGTEAPYQFVTVSTYDDLSKIEAPYSEELIRRAHPTVDVDEFFAETLAARELARTELWSQRDIVAQDVDVAVGDYITVAYMKVPPGGGSDYLRMEREIFKPVHALRVADGRIKNWAVNQLMMPGGMGGEYDWCVVTVRDQLGALFDNIPQEIFERAHPGIHGSIFKPAIEVRDMVRVELWQLVDQVR